jgi:hypothetical protein
VTKSTGWLLDQTTRGWVVSSLKLTRGAILIAATTCQPIKKDIKTYVEGDEL